MEILLLKKEYLEQLGVSTRNRQINEIYQANI